jgi:hypothetical protein
VPESFHTTAIGVLANGESTIIRRRAS